MYEVGEHDRVVELTDIPYSAVGAPLPRVLASDSRLVLLYIAEAVDAAWQGQTARSVSPQSADEIVVTLDFARPLAHYFGPPGDENFRNHPLASRGLSPYGAFTVADSSWVRQLERMNAVRGADAVRVQTDLQHFIFSFHDSTFECVARSFELEVRGGSLHGVAAEVLSRFSTRRT